MRRATILGALICASTAMGEAQAPSAKVEALAWLEGRWEGTKGGVLYATLRPCFGCAKESIQAGIRELVYDEPYEYGAGLEEAYRRLIEESGILLRRR